MIHFRLCIVCVSLSALLSADLCTNSVLLEFIFALCSSGSWFRDPERSISEVKFINTPPPPPRKRSLGVYCFKPVCPSVFVE